MREYGFELSLCARLEADRDAIVARQLGAGVAEPGGRVIDTALVEPGPAFVDRAQITDAAIPRLVLESDLGPGQARRVTKVIDTSPEHAREAAERAAAIGFLELERRDGDLHARQVTRYPQDWFGDLVGIENKPDLGTPGDLEAQLRTDVSLGVFDRVILATESYVTGAHLNRLPEEVGVWRYKPPSPDPLPVEDPESAAAGDGSIDVIREPTSLSTTEAGVEVLAQHPGQSEIEIVSAADVAAARRRIAERAYGKGWRPTELPDCDRFRLAECAGTPAVPYCEWNEEVTEPATDCGPACPGFEPAAPPSPDHEAERAARTPWVPSPDGYKRRQAGLDLFER